jgi:hypothetical protein
VSSTTDDRGDSPSVTGSGTPTTTTVDCTGGTAG